MAYFPNLFSEISIGNVKLKNRIVMPAMATNYSVDGAIPQMMIDYFVERAKGGVGFIITESSPVISPETGKMRRIHPNIGHDPFIPGLKKLTDAVHTFDTKIAIQLGHFGRQLQSDYFGAQIVAPSAIPCPVSRETPKELSIEEIESIIKSFIQAAKRAYEAGFDMVELHGCHGYLISEFFASRTNKRNDKYGGDVLGRSRFCTEIIQGIKREVGQLFPVIVRINGHDYIPAGATLEDMKEIAPVLAEAGADALDVSAGVYGSYRASIPPMFEGEGCFVELAEGIKKTVDIPVIAVGRIKDPYVAEEILASNKADMIAMGRALLADPELPLKAGSGAVDEILKCTGCNQGCIDRVNASMMKGVSEGITCLVNPRVGREAETEITMASQPKRILVVGGGPAGLESALISAMRGHTVSLWEKENVLGGQLRLVGMVPGRREFAEYILFLEDQAVAAGVEVTQSKTATAESIMEYAPDAVILAAGAVPNIPSFISGDSDRVVSAWDVLKGDAPTHQDVVILGGGAVGLETAHYLVEKNNRVTIVEATGVLGHDMGPIASFYLRNILKSARVSIMRCAPVIRVFENNVLISMEGKEVLLDTMDTIVLALGAKSNNSLAGEITGIIPEVHIIGDALQPRKALDAVAEGFDIGRTI